MQLLAQDSFYWNKKTNVLAQKLITYVASKLPL
jgi:hypothetical protein